MEPRVLMVVASVLAHGAMPSGASASCLGLGVLAQCEAHGVLEEHWATTVASQCDEDGDAALLPKIFSCSEMAAARTVGTSQPNSAVAVSFLLTFLP